MLKLFSMTSSEVERSTPQAVGESSHLRNLRNKLETAKLAVGLLTATFVGCIIVDGLYGDEITYERNHN
jgi:hypothetical protein